jgi:hypothetical protein
MLNRRTEVGGQEPMVTAALVSFALVALAWVVAPDGSRRRDA